MTRNERGTGGTYGRGGKVVKVHYGIRSTGLQLSRLLGLGTQYTLHFSYEAMTLHA